MRQLYAVALVLTGLAPVARAQTLIGSRDVANRLGDDRKHPLGAAQRERRRIAMRESIVAGGPLAGQGARVAKSADGRYVELEQTRSDRIFMLLAEFGDEQHPDFASQQLGPRHNQIAEPDRAVDNSQIWLRDFSPEHFSDIIGQMNDYFGWQSSGRYGVEGQPTEWLKVRYNAARYGRNQDNTWDLITDGLEQWVKARCAEGMTPEQVHDYLASFDVWDRYDYDQDGNFDEPDGYIDHFLIVHAGEGEETGGGAQGEDAIWSHRWFAYYDLLGSVGPEGNPLGGTEIGDTGIWVGDYTVQPESGGLGVFAHEFGHDLGLPDEYETAGGENSTGFWTLMSSGGYLGDGTIDIGSRPGDLNAWDKLQLGWLNFDTAAAGEVSTHTLGVAEYNSDVAQALVVALPDRKRTLELAEPPEGGLAWWSDMGNELDNSLVHPLDVPATDPLLEMSLWYDIEDGWDYAYVSVSTDDGATWVNLAGNPTTPDDPNAQNEGNGITGTSGDWVAATFELSAYAGSSVLLGIRYATDGAVAGKGLLADAISVSSVAGGTSEALEDWTASGFTETTGTQTLTSFNAYIAENRRYVSYDATLATGPYNFGFVDTLPNWVEHYPYQDGLLISYWDEHCEDNNTSEHPGEGLILPVDAHPDQLIRPDGLPWLGRIQSFDSAFGLEPTEPLSLHRQGLESLHPSLPAVPLFDDLKSYYRPVPESSEWSPWTGVAVPHTGTQIQVVQTSARGQLLQVRVQPSLQ
jgi:immune inhibitor A